MDDDGYEEILEQLTDDQIAFLRRHRIGLVDVFDAEGYSQARYRHEMSVHEKVVAINVSPCRAYGHRLRTGGGHCAQCKPECLAFQQRYREEAYVYVLGSLQQRILKIGFSQDPFERSNHLSRLRYGAATDWQLLCCVRCKRAGALEHSLLVMFRDKSVFAKYWKDRKYQRCFELLRCNYSDLRRALGDLTEKITDHSWAHDIDTRNFQFG
jgi:hypothetical protein